MTFTRKVRRSLKQHHTNLRDGLRFYSYYEKILDTAYANGALGGKLMDPVVVVVVMYMLMMKIVKKL